MTRQSGAGKRRATPLDPSTATPFGKAIGHQLRRAREDTERSADSLASHARFLGLGWDRPTVSRIENGQRALTAAELLMLPLVYGRPLTDLLPAEPCALTEDAAVEPAELRSVLTEGPQMRRWTLPRLYDAAATGVERMKPVLKAFQSRHPGVPAWTLLKAASSGWADETTGKAAARLGVSREAVAVAAQHTWGRGLAAERDARLEHGGAASTARGRQAQRGHITRTLLDELRPVVEELQHTREGSQHGE
ncbi:MAG: helix-turn-helix domain-containing protein [Actinomycetota bacterium]|nr:helix-turn-helix domain-containing protein [Actinomycetota bacterium]